MIYAYGNFRPMRRYIASLMSAVLMMISSLPLVSVAEACPMPEQAMLEAAADMNAGHTMAMHASDIAAAGHSIVMSDDMQDCRMECGCGHHQSLDALPHQLAPHVFAGQTETCASHANAQASIYRIPFYELTLGVELPPPDLG